MKLIVPISIQPAVGLASDDGHLAQLIKTGFWGKRGAGLLFLALNTGRILVAHRSSKVEQPGTWGTWGGALDEEETPEEGAEREAREETNYKGPMVLKFLWTFTHPSGFKYDNYLATIPKEFKPVLGWETQGTKWIEPHEEWPTPTHPGLKALLKAKGQRLDLV